MGVDAEGRPPVRLCCMDRHWGVECPDGTVMCCLCFGKFLPEDLITDPEDGKKWDVCIDCELHEWGYASRPPGTLIT